jgi:hypothetical protein
VNLSVCSFEHEVAAAGLASSVLFTMHQDPAFQCGETAEVEHRQWEPLIGHQESAAPPVFSAGRRFVA